MSTASPTPGRLRSLQRRLMLTVALGALLFSVLAGALAWQLGHERAIADSRSTLEGLARAVDKTLAVGAFAADAVLLQEVVDGLARDDLVAGAEVRAAGGASLAHSVHAGAAAPTAAGMVIERPLLSPFDAAERVGTLRIRADEARIDAVASRQAYTLAALMAGQAALLALLLYGVAERLVSRPIVSLARQLRAMSPGAAERLATPARHRSDEIGVLIDGANALLEANAVALQRERRLRAEIEVMEAQYRQIFDASSAGIFVLDGDGRLINGNPTVCKVVGMTLAQLRALRDGDFVQRVFSRPERVRDMVAQARQRGETISADLELLQPGAARRWVHCLISVQGGPAVAVAADRDPGRAMVEGVIYDITERKSAESDVRYRAEHDALTGLSNRAACQATLDRLVAEGESNGSFLTLLCIDLDHFKQINDSLGHQAGDQVLRCCAGRIKAAVRRSTDLVGRPGGDEFVVALRGIGPADPALCDTAAALLLALAQPVVLDDGTPVQVGASIGIACLPRHGRDAAALSHAADLAMYEVKRNGRNSFAMALPEVPAEAAALGAAPAPDRLLCSAEV